MKGLSRLPQEAPPPWRPPPLDGLVPIPTYLDAPITPVANLRGVDLEREPVRVEVVGSGHWTLLVFLSADCTGCLPIWEALADPAGSGLAKNEVVVAVTRDPGTDDPEVLRSLVPTGATVVMSDDAWSAYRVQGAPFFALIDGRADAPSTVATEGVAWAVEQIAADVARARGRT